MKPEFSSEKMKMYLKRIYLREIKKIYFKEILANVDIRCIRASFPISSKSLDILGNETLEKLLLRD